MNIWSVGMTLEEAERNIITNALRFYQYNKTHTAKSLGISLRGLDGKMEKLNIENLRGKLDNIKEDNEQERRSEEEAEREATNTDKGRKDTTSKNRKKGKKFF